MEPLEDALTRYINSQTRSIQQSFRVNSFKSVSLERKFSFFLFNYKKREKKNKSEIPFQMQTPMILKSKVWNFQLINGKIKEDTQFSRESSITDLDFSANREFIGALQERELVAMVVTRCQVD